MSRQPARVWKRFASVLVGDDFFVGQKLARKTGILGYRLHAGEAKTADQWGKMTPFVFMAPWRKVRTTQRRYPNKQETAHWETAGGTTEEQNAAHFESHLVPGTNNCHYPATECRESIENQPATGNYSKVLVGGKLAYAENPSCGCPVGPEGEMGPPGFDPASDLRDATTLAVHAAETTSQTDEPNK